MDEVEERSDSELVDSARDGDTDAFAELWRRHASAGRTVARSFTDADADDVVAEAYARILQAVRDGRGPTNGFRPYLFTTIRNVAAGWGRSRREVGIEDATTIEDPTTTESASMEELDRSLTAKAFRSLPDRWQEVLWYVEVERMTPAAVAPLLGMTPNAVSALAYRAREGLRQAWIQAHIQSSPEGSIHRWTTERLGAYSRGGLGKRDTARIERHLAECARCSIVAAEADRIGSHLSMVLLPLLLGVGGAAAYAASIHQGAEAAATAAGAGASANGGAGSTAQVGGRAARSGSRGATATGIAVAGVVVAAGVAGAIVLGPRLFPEAPPTSVAAAGPSTAPEQPTTEDPAQDADAPAESPAAPTTPEPPRNPGDAPVEPPTEPRTGAPVDATPAVPASPGDQAGAPSGPPTPGAPTSPGTPTTPPTTPPPAPPTEPPPAAPVITTPVPEGFETAGTTLALSGTGRPGATVTVVPVRASTAVSVYSAAASAPAPAGPVLGRAVVAADGGWSLTADLSALKDGTWALDVSQKTRGGASPIASVTITVDRTALPPVVDGVDTGTGDLLDRLAPILTGTAEPGAAVELFDHGLPVATVTADADGRWTSPELIAIRPDYALTARQTDRLGNVSTDSLPVTGHAVVATVTASGGPGTVSLQAHGIPGETVQVWADGRFSGYTLTFDQSGEAGQTYGWTTGDHRIGVLYTAGDRHGVLSDVPVTLP